MFENNLASLESFNANKMFIADACVRPLASSTHEASDIQLINKKAIKGVLA